MLPAKGSLEERRIHRAEIGTGRLRFFRMLRRHGHYVDTEVISDVKAANPGWQADLQFASYVAAVDAGLIKQPLGRPRFSEIYNSNETLAVREYHILRVRLTRLNRRGKEQFLGWCRKRNLTSRAPLTPAQVAAETVLRDRGINMSVQSFWNFVSRVKKSFGTTGSRFVDEIEGMYTSSHCTWKGTPKFSIYL